MNQHQSMLQPSWSLQPANGVAATCQFDEFSGSKGHAGMDLPGLIEAVLPNFGFSTRQKPDGRFFKFRVRHSLMVICL